MNWIRLPEEDEIEIPSFITLSKKAQKSPVTKPTFGKEWIGDVFTTGNFLAFQSKKRFLLPRIWEFSAFLTHGLSIQRSNQSLGGTLDRRAFFRAHCYAKLGPKRAGKIFRVNF